MQGMMDTMAWHKQVTKNWEDLAPGCTPLVRDAFIKRTFKIVTELAAVRRSGPIAIG